MIIRRTMLNAGSQALGKEGNENDDGSSGELHSFWLLGIEVCRLEKTSGLVSTKSHRIYTILWDKNITTLVNCLLCSWNAWKSGNTTVQLLFRMTEYGPTRRIHQAVGRRFRMRTICRHNPLNSDIDTAHIIIYNHIYLQSTVRSTDPNSP